MKFGLTFEEHNLLLEVMLRPLIEQGVDVWIFGSRARGEQRPASDVDVLFQKKRTLPEGFLFKLKSEIEDSRFPYKVDLVDVEEIASSYKEQVLKERVVVEIPTVEKCK